MESWAPRLGKEGSEGRGEVGKGDVREAVGDRQAYSSPCTTLKQKQIKCFKQF